MHVGKVALSSKIRVLFTRFVLLDVQGILSLPSMCLYIWAMSLISSLFVEGLAGATSDLGMVYNRARVLLHSDEHPGNFVASKVGPSFSFSPIPLGPCLFPYLLLQGTTSINS
jgi:hypothetical protein